MPLLWVKENAVEDGRTRNRDRVGHSLCWVTRYACTLTIIIFLFILAFAVSYVLSLRRTLIKELEEELMELGLDQRYKFYLSFMKVTAIILED